MSRSSLALALVLVFAATAAAQDALTHARNLYESAAYEEALSEFGRLKADASATTVAEIDRYRALCLMALSRGSEADKVIESIVTNDPLYQPAATDAAPRVRAAFSAVRQRVLPGVARQLYVDAKTLFDRKAYPEAVQALEKTVNVIDNIDGAGQSELRDLRLLAAGFLDLSRASLRPAPLPAADQAAATAPKAEAAPVSASLPKSTNLVVLKQDLPPLPFSLAAAGKQEYRGSIDVMIDEAGKVTDVRLLQSVHALYDVLLMKAARDWIYEPPRIAGKPTASRKRVEIVLRP
jgi:tetratricopeptide (TPR) repeat protein